jgi:hypothetical protein
MRQRVWGLLSILLLPACSLYWGTNGRDGGVEGEVDAGATPDAPTDAAVACAVRVSYDWNDGTTQGWSASTAVTNVGGALVFTNQGNGSLQAFGPEAPSALAETDAISFSVRIDRYSTVTAPSQLIRSFFALDTPFPGDGSLEFALDVSTLAFGQPHVFTFPVSAGTFTGSLTRAAFLGHVKFASLLFADQYFSSNTSAGTLDDFAIVQTAGCLP